MADAYSLATGQDVPVQLRRRMRGWTKAVDISTGLIPEVQALRLPSEISDMALGQIDGKPPTGDELSGMIQFASPRGMGEVGNARDAVVQNTGEHTPSAPSRGESPQQAPKHEAMEPPVVPSNLEGRHMPANRFVIHGEFDHLDGYEQRFTEAELPTENANRLVIVGGQHYLRGEAGYYRATRGGSDDHWLIDAPRKDRAQVPVVYDPATREWHAYEPLRVCGGGCGSSRHAMTDSIATSYEDIFAATRHLPDEAAQEAISNAFNDLGLMNLRRSNRPDLHAVRDNSIIDHRAALRVAMKDLDRSLPLIKQQVLTSEVTARYYIDRPQAEAFCQENAEILFSFLLEDGISSTQLRMITVQPRNRAPHVMVLYTESSEFIRRLDDSTPQPRVSLTQEGMPSVQFAWAIYATRDTTVLLDPWSQNKAISFARAASPGEVMNILDEAFSDIGHSTGSPYQVTITRPLASRRGTSSSQSSLGSVASPGHSVGSRTSGFSASSSASGATPDQTPELPRSAITDRSRKPRGHSHMPDGLTN